MHRLASSSRFSPKRTFVSPLQVYASAYVRFNSSTAPKEKLFDKILIANRGEIACRVMRTAKRLGIRTVAVYSDADKHALHVRAADEAVNVGPAPTSQSYLNIENIVEACKKTGAQAVHPGYGFLSENAKFVAALDKAGIAFIGPGTEAMHAMGDKIESKKIAKKAGVNVIPGFLGEVDDIQHVIKIAKEIGYPVMVKASAGGGGKGMRICWNDDDVNVNFRLSKQEARSSFGDDRMLIEKYIDSGRHIEIQVLADGKGTSLYFPERECSIQRRNQKVIEEAPSPFLDEKTRKAMGEQAVALVNAVGYKSAGTVEFLVDSSRNFYFLEMNTRLQVEHPITEYITGVDLVEGMIRVAAGAPLNMRQSDINIKGWAMESRVYAEDPYRDFLPSIGKLQSYRPPSGEGVRVDEGVYEGGEISIYYDPLICKLVTHGSTREESIARMKKALDAYVIRGVNHNIPFLRAVMENQRFLEGRLNTKFIPEEFPQGFKGFVYTPEQTTELTALTAALKLASTRRDWSISDQLDPNAVRPAKLELAVTINGENPTTTNVEVTQVDEDVYSVKVQGKEETKVELDWAIGSTAVEAQFSKSGTRVVSQITKRKPLGYKLIFLGSEVDVSVMTPRQHELLTNMPEKKEKEGHNQLRSPMPGAIQSVAVKPGDKVILAQELVIVEAMKMQNVLRAPKDGVVKSVLVKPGQTVAVDEVLVEFE